MRQLLFAFLLFTVQAVASSVTLEESVGQRPLFIPKVEVDRILSETGLQPRELLQQLIPIVKKRARPPISNYFVGCAALGESGNIYAGVNLEFMGCPLNQAVHGEQFLITNAILHGEKSLEAIAISAAPCGHCRQFMNEIGEEATFAILVLDNPPEKLSNLLPSAFGPQDLNLSGRLLSPRGDFELAKSAPTLLEAARLAASLSYVPYTNSPSGVALRTFDGQIYTGCSFENAAYNPSLSPLQVALVSLIADGHPYSDIAEAILAEKPTNISHETATREVLRSVAPSITLQVVHIN